MRRDLCGAMPDPRDPSRTRRLYQRRDNRLLRRLPWRAEDRAPVLEHLGTATIPDVDLRALREREGLSRPDFAALYGLPVSCVEKWETGAAQPNRAARVLLAVIRDHPHLVRRTLGLRW